MANITGLADNDTWIQWTTTTTDTTVLDSTWQTWSAGATTYTGTTSSTSDTAWAGWNLVGENRNVTSSTTWYTWMTTDGEVAQYEVSDLERHNQRYVPSPPETEEERTARVARQATNARERQLRMKEREASRLAAKKKADTLLRRHLSPAQLKEYESHDAFDVKIEDRHYRIHNGWAGNVLLMKKGKCVASFCIHPRITAPNEDNMLAQKFLLESNEKEFLAIANKAVHRGHHAYQPW